MKIAKERMNRVVVKGKPVIKRYLVKEEDNNNDDEDKDKQENDDINMLFYESSEYNG